MAENSKIKLKIDGMSCVNCALGIEKHLKNKGVSDAMVSFPNASASFTADQEQLPQLINGIESLGFKVENPDLEQPKDKKRKVDSLLIKVIIASLFTIPLLLAMVLPYPELKNPNLQLALTIPVMLIGSWQFGRSAFASIKSTVANMDVLIFLGSTSAFIYSLIGFIYELGPNYLFFETATTIITLVLIGNWIEKKSIKKTTSAIRSLIDLQPENAKRLINDNNKKDAYEEININQVELEDILLINEGDKIPADGKVVWGKASINQALMTGESETVNKESGDEVIGGTMVENGSLKFKVTKIGEDTALSQIIALVQEAQDKKPPIQKLADKISSVFIPLVLLAAALAFFVNYFFINLNFQQAMLRSIAVLVVACPCAMGLATPTAIIAGLGRAAKNGILFKGAEAIEDLRNLKHIVFDKTGTLTTGSFTDFDSKTNLDKTLFRSILMSLEQHSSHPLAKYIVSKLESYPNVKPFHFEEIREIKGIGIIGKDGQGNSYTAGSYKLIKDQNIENDHSIYLLKNGNVMGWIDTEDNVKENAPKVIREIIEMNIKPHLLSGDKSIKTAPVANAIGIRNFHSDKLPQEKLDFIKSLSSTGKTAMVGDGINDAPALTAADVGISLSNASNIAIQSAQVILLNGDLSKIPLAIKLSRATVKTIKQNLFWAFIYNIIMIPLAAMGLISPMIAALAMVFSSIFVIGNSIRLSKIMLE